MGWVRVLPTMVISPHSFLLTLMCRFYMVRVNVFFRVSGAVIKGDKILMASHRSDDGKQFWIFPGGGIEEGENIHQALIREMKEETGYHVEVKDLLFVDEAIAPDGSTSAVQLVFHVEETGGELKPGSHDLYDYVPVRFVKYDEISMDNCPVWSLVKEVQAKGIDGLQLRYVTRPVFGDPDKFRNFDWYTTKN